MARRRGKLAIAVKGMMDRVEAAVEPVVKAAVKPPVEVATEAAAGVVIGVGNSTVLVIRGGEIMPSGHVSCREIYRRAAYRRGDATNETK